MNSLYFFNEALEKFRQSLVALNLDGRNVGLALKILQETNSLCVSTGVGKSGFIAQKMVATLNSLGIRSVFLNPTDALHGDLGVVDSESVVFLISNSGSTAELCNLIPSLKHRKCKLIAIVASLDSSLADVADCVIAYGQLKEADEFGLAPTTSTVVQLAIVDAIAAAVSRSRGFKPRDFFGNHPSGALGKRLSSVEAVMRVGDELPVVGPESLLADVLSTITAKRIGSACVIDNAGHLLGLITDGDIRRGLEKKVDIYSSTAESLMQSQPQVSTLGDRVEQLLVNGCHFNRHFTVPVVDHNNMLRGILVSGASHGRCPNFMPRVLNPLGRCSVLLAG